MIRNTHTNIRQCVLCRRLYVISLWYVKPVHADILYNYTFFVVSLKDMFIHIWWGGLSTPYTTRANLRETWNHMFSSHFTCFFSWHQVLRATDSALIAPLATAVGQSLTLRWGQINSMSVCVFSAPANSILHTTYLLSHQSYCTVTAALVSIHQTEPTLTLAVQPVSRCPLNLWHAQHKYMWSWDADRGSDYFSSSAPKIPLSTDLHLELLC